MPVTALQKRIYTNGAICGVVLMLLITAIDLLGGLTPLENALYDRRALTCQIFAPEPSPDIVFLDIDDYALEVIHRWPWDRSDMAAVLNELKLAGPKVVALDILYSETQKDFSAVNADGQPEMVEQDGALARAIGELGNVVLGTSFNVASAPDAYSNLRERAVQVLASNITLDRRSLLSELKLSKAEMAVLQPQFDGDFAAIRRAAIRDAIRQADPNQTTTPDDIIKKLAGALNPSASIAATELNESTQQTIRKEFERVRSEHWLERHMVQPPRKLAIEPPDATPNAIPLPAFCERMKDSGFTDNKFFADGAVRSMPLFMKVDHRFYPHFALVTACQLLNADIKNASFTESSVIIPLPKGEIRIPVRSVPSQTMRRQVGYVMDIPWFGTRDWETMYDWPGHQKSAQRFPIDSIWSSVETQRRIDRNNSRIDGYLQVFYALYPSSKQNNVDRTTAATNVLKTLDEVGFNDSLADSLNTLPADDKKAFDTMMALKRAMVQNAKLSEELKRLRATNVQRYANKAVLIGATATGASDFARTSLHNSAPGVVVHGTIANAIINRDFLTAAPQWLNVLLTLFAGIAATLITCMLPPARGLFFLFLLGVGYFITNGVLLYDRLNLVVDAGAPMVAMFVCWGGVLVVRTIVETLERIRLNQEAAVIDHEIELARQVQKGLIPKELQVLPTVDSHGWTKAATTTGGDCFDLWKLKDGRMGILVGDASGHGLGPSLVVSQVRALVRSMCDLYENPQDLLNAVNLRLYEDLDGRKFCTCFLGFLSEDGKLAWASAGHGPMLWATTRDAPIEELNGTALPLGVSDDPGADEFIPVLEIQETGWLAVTSDGIFEAGDPKGEQFGVDRITAAIRSAQDGPSEAVVDALRKSVDAWQVKLLPDDDQTIVFLRRRAKSPTEPQK